MPLAPLIMRQAQCGFPEPPAALDINTRALGVERHEAQATDAHTDRTHDASGGKPESQPGQPANHSKSQMKIVKYPFLTALLAIIALAAWLLNTGAFTPDTAVAFVVIGQLGLFTMSRPRSACLMAAVSDYQVAELDEMLRNTRDSLKKYADVPGQIEKLEKDVNSMRRSRLQGMGGTARPRGKISDDAARELAAAFIIHCARNGAMEAWCQEPSKRDFLINEARQIAGISTRAAFTTSDIPLPVSYAGQIIELIAEFGVVRNEMTLYPMSGGTNKPPRMGTRPAFQSIAMSATFPQLVPGVTFAALESHKIGGVCILPREIDDQSIIPMGQFLAHYGAVEFARAEDTWGFLADGSATYEQVKGVCQIASENSKVNTLAAGKTAPSDTTLDDLRALRQLVNTACLSRGGKYYLNATWEARLRKFNNNQNDPYVYMVMPDGTAKLDGFEIVWTEVLTPYSTTPSPSSYLAVFGNLGFWWMGERGQPRIDTSIHPLFLNDQIATRFIEEIDFDYNSLQAAGALKTAAA